MSSPSFDLVALGESGVRLAAPDGRRLEDAAALELHVVGAEGNVAAALAALGRRCAWLSALPDAPLGRRTAREYRALGVDVSGVAWRPTGRTAFFFTEAAAPPLPARVVYDRDRTAMRTLRPEELDWEKIEGARFVHMTGITPALSESCRLCVAEAARRARAAGARVSFDLNYRAQLWTPQAARTALEPIMRLADVLFCPKGDAARALGLTGDAAAVARQLAESAGARWTVVSDGGGDIVGLADGRLVRQPARPARPLDRVGAGDALTAGVLDGLLDDDFAAGLARGAVLAAAALGRRGDMALVARDELEAALRRDDDDGGVAR